MFPPLSIILLFILGIVASLASVDPESMVLDNFLPNSSPSDESGNSISESNAMTPFKDANKSPFLAPIAASDGPPLLAAGVTTSLNDILGSDVLASGTAQGAADGAGALNFDDIHIPDDASAECITDTHNARMRVRRGCIPEPNAQPNSDTKKNDGPIDGTKSSVGQTGGEQVNNKQKDIEDNGVNVGLSLDLFIPSLDYRIPKKDFIVCDPRLYRDSNIPMCDTGNRRRDVVEYYIGVVKYGLLFRPHPCKFIFKNALSPYRLGEAFLFGR